MQSGEIEMTNGFVFKWMMSGTTTPEVYGWIEKNYSILKGSGGYWRTSDPQEACKRAALSFDAELAAA